MFSLLAVECKVIQQIAFELLHRHIPQAQEQVSFDVALSKTTVNLPDELLSLLLEVPQANLAPSLSDAKTLLRIRSYLMSWKLVFDHFSGSAVSIPAIYPRQIKLTRDDSHFLFRKITREISKSTRFWSHCWGLPLTFSKNRMVNLWMLRDSTFAHGNLLMSPVRGILNGS
jgi:hypothetical protein